MAASISNLSLDGFELLGAEGLAGDGRETPHSTGTDPWIVFRPNQVTRCVYVKIGVDESCLLPGDICRVYFALDGAPGFNETDCLSFSLNGDGFVEVAAVCDSAVCSLRIDPVERKGNLPVTSIELRAYDCEEAFLQDYIPDVQDGLIVLTHDISKTGAPILAYNIARSFQSVGRSVRVFSIGDTTGGISSRYLNCSLPLSPLFLMKPVGKCVSNESLASRMLDRLYEAGYHSALLNTVVSGEYAGLAKHSGMRVHTLIHETAEVIRMHNWHTAAREVAMFSDTIVFPCEQVRDGFLNLVSQTSGKIIIMPQGVYLENTVAPENEAGRLFQSLGIGIDDKLILSSGTIEMRKGTDLFVSAALSLYGTVCAEKRQRIHVLWVGDGHGDLLPWLKNQIDTCGAGDFIRFIPFMDHGLYKLLLERADLFWSTSRNDTYPSVVLEAMRQGVPVIALSGAVGVDSMLSDGRGILVDFYSAEGVARESMNLLDDRRRAAAISRNAQSWVKSKLDFSNYVEALIEVCDSSQTVDCEYVRKVLSSGWDRSLQASSPKKISDVLQVEDIRSIQKEHARNSRSLFALRRRAPETCVHNAPVLLDVSLGSDNIGDHVIMDYCFQACSSALGTDRLDRVPTHRYAPELDHIRGKLKILCGTYLIYTHMEQSTQWAFPHDVRNFDNLCMLGVGMQDLGIDEPFSEYSLELLHLLLDNKWLHSVRDGYTMRRLHEIGIENVVNTACPTMWNLTPAHCSSIPKDKAPCCVATVTCHVPDADADAYMLQTLLSEYKHVFIWLQGPYDYTYCLKGVVDPTAFTILPPSLEALDRVLERDDVDYIGARLHAGIRALNHGRRSLVITVDNRARHIAQDTGLPTLERTELREKLVDWINGSHATEIVLPDKAIAAWKMQFRRNN